MCSREVSIHMCVMLPPNKMWILQAESMDRNNCQHLCTLVDFAFEMKEKLEELNRHAFNNFKLRIGTSDKRSVLIIPWFLCVQRDSDKSCVYMLSPATTCW